MQYSTAFHTLLCAFHKAARKCYNYYFLQVLPRRFPMRAAGRVQRYKLAVQFDEYRKRLRSVPYPFHRGSS